MGKTPCQPLCHRHSRLSGVQALDGLQATACKGARLSDPCRDRDRVPVVPSTRGHIQVAESRGSCSGLGNSASSVLGSLALGCRSPPGDSRRLRRWQDCIASPLHAALTKGPWQMLSSSRPGCSSSYPGSGLGPRAAWSPLHPGFDQGAKNTPLQLTCKTKWFAQAWVVHGSWPYWSLKSPPNPQDTPRGDSPRVQMGKTRHTSISGLGKGPSCLGR